MNERVKRKLQDLTILNLKSFLSDENMENELHLEKRRMAILLAPLYILSRITIFFFVNPQLELLKHKYKKFQNIDQRYPWVCSKRRKPCFRIPGILGLLGFRKSLAHVVEPTSNQQQVPFFMCTQDTLLSGYPDTLLR